MLLILQIALAVMFIITLFQVIIDFIHGTLLIVSGLMLIVVGYVLKLSAWILQIIRRRPSTVRQPVAKPAQKRSTWPIFR
jgi:hypothetical protein